jgi:CBS domain-containing protein
MNETVIGTMARTTAAQFRHVPVVEESRLAGIVSIGDVMKWRLDEPKHESARASLAPAVHVDRIAAMAKPRAHTRRGDGGSCSSSRTAFAKFSISPR